MLNLNYGVNQRSDANINKAFLEASSNSRNALKGTLNVSYIYQV